MVKRTVRRAEHKRTGKTKRLLGRRISLVVMVGAAILFAGLLALQVIRKSDPEDYYTLKHWSAITAQGFFDSCVESVAHTGSSVTSQTVKTYCGCALNALQDIYVTEQQLSLMEEKATQEGYPVEFISVIRTCAEQTGVPLDTQPSGGPSSGVGELDTNPPGWSA